jgi:two-component system chemotaxis sensor kinase CheA
MIQGGFKELLDEFLLEARERADEVESLLLRLPAGGSEDRHASLAQAKRELHTLKGNSGMMGFTDLQELAHRMEDEVDSLDLAEEELAIDGLLQKVDSLRHGLEEIGARVDDFAELGAEPEPTAPEAAAADDGTAAEVGSGEAAMSSVRVSFSKIDQLVELQAETLIFRNRLSDAIARGRQLIKAADGSGERRESGIDAAWESVEIAQQSLEKTLDLLQDRVMELSLVPLQGLFRSLRRIVHDESNREGKKVEMQVAGGDTPIDKTLLEAAGDALGHLVRNSVIHGIESPEERRQEGKPATGRVRVAATLDANEVVIEVSDDGAGIDLAGLRAKAERIRGRSAELGSDFALLFAEGVSTREGTDLSAGRGVGLSAVKRSVEGHGGRINVRSERGRGTVFSLRLPVTASILRSVLLRADGEDYALPLTAVAETLRPAPADRHRINHAGVLRWRGRVVPLLDLGFAFGTARGVRDEGFIVVMEVNGRYRGLAVDEIAGIHDIVVKGLDQIVGRPVGISGSTILGDGRVIMILDPATLASIPPFTS